MNLEKGNNANLTIRVDADACPGPIKQILFKAAKRKQIALVLIANRPLFAPESPYISTRIVPEGFDVADDTIIEEVQKGDLVVTADIPLAAAVIEKGALALTPRGLLYTRENIGEQLSIRNFMDDLRSSGVTTGGPSAFSLKNRESFANQLEQILSQHFQKRGK